MTLWDVHTLPGAGPVRHYQQYLDEGLARRFADRYASVLHAELVVEPLELPEPAGLLGREVTG